MEKRSILIVNYMEQFTDYFHNREISKYNQKFKRMLNKYFKYVKIYHCTIPSYIGSFYSFLFCSNEIDPLELEIDWSIYRSKRIKTKYYNEGVHRCSFSSPNFINF